ncbi:hypothetical protein O3M35_007944 [Rhynocoris fuscipes]|uniref:RING-type E3 ubiquitin transferase n=1 Tax=Rhynocoris fuscipes TaxID=488301 RepID=A0AAW1DDT5_9HEMI
MWKIIVLTLLSAVASLLVIVNAFYQKKQFYPAIVFIMKSNGSMVVFYFQIFILFTIIANIIKLIFFGELRRAEIDRLTDRTWYTLTETCLSFAVFREDFNQIFLGLLLLLVILKVFHWLADERVEFIEQRLISILAILSTVDVFFIYEAVESTMRLGPTAQLVFGFEYAILLTLSWNSFIKYIFHIIDTYVSPWENKTYYLLYSELIIRAIRVAIYVVFVLIMLNIYIVPLFVFRPMLFTLKSFRKSLNDVTLWQRAIYNLNTLYPDASEQELTRSDNVCIICREEMLRTCKILPCNHIFHTVCLRSWFQRQQSCPICRLNILNVNYDNLNSTNDIQQQNETLNNIQETTEIIINNVELNTLEEINKFNNSLDYHRLKLRCTVPALISMHTLLQVSHPITEHYMKRSETEEINANRK